MTPADGAPPPGPSPLPGALRLPDGAWVRGRALRRPVPAGPLPDAGLLLGAAACAAGCPPWPHGHVDWPDLRLPRDPRHAARALLDLHARARAGDRVEVACRGGRGRTGTALAALAVLAGVPPERAVAWVREHHDPRAVETPWQRRWVVRFPELVTEATGAG